MIVHDDGDSITLDDSLEERLAKVIKRGDQSPEAELAIATNPTDEGWHPIDGVVRGSEQ